MKKKPSRRSRDRGRDTMRPEYDFSRAVRGATATRYKEGANIVVIDPSVLEHFPRWPAREPGAPRPRPRAPRATPSKVARCERDGIRGWRIHHDDGHRDTYDAPPAGSQCTAPRRVPFCASHGDVRGSHYFLSRLGRSPLESSPGLLGMAFWMICKSVAASGAWKV